LRIIDCLAFAGNRFYISNINERLLWKDKSMFKIVLSQIPAGGSALLYEKKASVFPTLKQMIEAGEVAFDGPLTFELMVLFERDMIRVDGQLQANLVLTCSRCLESFKNRIEHPFTLRFARQAIRDARLERGAEVELTTDQIGLSFFDGEEIDLRDALQEQIILALPYKPLCREACKGLCPHCGADLNRESCQCRERVQGGPFDRLKSLKLRSD
jgi:uncharacterized protein